MFFFRKAVILSAAGRSIFLKSCSVCMFSVMNRDLIIFTILCWHTQCQCKHNQTHTCKKITQSKSMPVFCMSDWIALEKSHGLYGDLMAFWSISGEFYGGGYFGTISKNRNSGIFSISGEFIGVAILGQFPRIEILGFFLFRESVSISGFYIRFWISCL